ncbi:uncharacterized protein KY384_008869 [Bacidia gigantensis]|uniref:uncharacterized protein n=1 Tax=Bacidia gigantensis TaxID=2732470 RepID=UPI001D04592C|nr:uncharacterized protein KY384_008869 [Bacidia gigantensis]KAG8525225.1 hypothetical protein KY384_008869 [Bacidia gigantensis]
MDDFSDTTTRRSSDACESSSSSSTILGEEEPKDFFESGGEGTTIQEQMEAYATVAGIYAVRWRRSLQEWGALERLQTSGVRWRRSIVFALAIVSILLLCLTYSTPSIANTFNTLPNNSSSLRPVDRLTQPEPTPEPDSAHTKPRDVKIFALITAGRRANLEILDCYLRKNLVSNGGWLDGVHFAINTHNEDDIAWIDSAVSEVDEYKGIPLNVIGNEFAVFFSLYQQVLEPGHIYFKIDDDTAWLSENAISEMVTQLVNHPDAFLVSANLINSAEMGWMHRGRGAIHAYLPEPTAPSTPPKPYSWRPSELPTYSAPLPLDGTALPGHPKDGGYEEPSETEYVSPYHHHRWLPLRDDSLLPLTPMWHTAYAKYSPDFSHWTHAAQKHYSLLENIERDELWRYDFGGPDGTWNMMYHHMNINFIAFRSDDMLRALEFAGPGGKGWRRAGMMSGFSPWMRRDG